MATRFRSTVATVLTRFVVLAALMCALGAHQANAATFEFIGPGMISVQGPIEPGDCNRWTATLVSGLSGVLLNSLGGRVNEGECISRSIARMHLRTVVLQKCASICFLMFAAGRERHVCEGARIGIHRPSIIGTREENPDPRVLNSILDHAAHFGVPDAIRIKLSLTPNKEVYWMSNEDLGMMDVRDCR